MGNPRLLVVRYARAGPVGRSAESVGDIQGEVEAEAAGQRPAGQQLVSSCGVEVGLLVDEQGREDRPDCQGNGPSGLNVVRVDVQAFVGEAVEVGGQQRRAIASRSCSVAAPDSKRPTSS